MSIITRFASVPRFLLLAAMIVWALTCSWGCGSSSGTTPKPAPSASVPAAAATSSARTTERHIDEARDETSALTPETVEARKPVVIQHLDSAKTSNASTIDHLIEASKRIDELQRANNDLQAQLTTAKDRADLAERKAHSARLGWLTAIGVLAAGVGAALLISPVTRFAGVPAIVFGVGVAVTSRLLATIDDWLITAAIWSAGVVMVGGVGVGVYLLGRHLGWWEGNARLLIDALEDADKLRLDAKAQKASVARKAPPEFHAVVKEQTRPANV